MACQALTGVVDATYGAGYKLDVRNGSSNTTLRGVESQAFLALLIAVFEAQPTCLRRRKIGIVIV